MFRGTRPWTIVSFAPGARGFKLAKFLINNQLAHSDYFSPFFHNDSQNTHHFQTAFTDVLLNWWTPEQKKSFLKTQSLIFSYGQDTDWVQQELHQNLLTSDFCPRNPDLPHVICVHFPSLFGLRLLSNVCNAAKVIRITFDSVEQAKSTLERKCALANITLDPTIFEQTLIDNYLPFLYSHRDCVNIPLTLIEQDNSAEITKLLTA
jgi:hypothetical protein